MWNPSNKELCERFGPGRPLPGETDYGTYVARELISLGYAPKQVYLTGQPAFVMAMPVLGGLSEVLLICRVLQGDVNANAARVLASLRSVRRSGVCVVVTTGKLDSQARQFFAANKIFCADQFMVGGDAGRILSAAGLVPEALLRMLSGASARVAALEGKLAETQSALAYQEQQLDKAMRGAPLEVEKDPTRMTAVEKLKAGMMDPMLPKAMSAVCGVNATSAGALVKRIRCTPEKAEKLLSELEELGVVTAAKPGAARFVKMTKVMMEKNFGLSNLTKDDLL